VTERGAQIVLSDVADMRIVDGPPMLKSENARLSGWVYVDVRGRALRSAVLDMQTRGRIAGSSARRLFDLVSGQFRVPRAGDARLKIAVPFTLL